MPAFTPFNEFPGQVTTLDGFNMAKAEAGDMVIIDSPESIDRSVNVLGHQLMIICGHDQPFIPDSTAFSGQRTKRRMQSMSELVVAGANPDAITETAFFVVVPPRTFPNWAKSVGAMSEEPNYFRNVGAKLAIAVTVEQEGLVTFTHGRIFNLLAHSDRVRLEKVPTPIAVRSTPELRDRLERGVSHAKGARFNSPRETARPNIGLARAVEVLKARTPLL